MTSTNERVAAVLSAEAIARSSIGRLDRSRRGEPSLTMEGNWVHIAQRLAASIAEFTRVAPRERWLTDRLLEVTYEPNDPSSAPMTLLAASEQLIFSAGRGARFELDAPERSFEEVVRLARAVAAGGLTETVRRLSVRFVIDLGDGEEVSGSSWLGRDWRKEERGTYRYAPYPAAGGEDPRPID